MREDLPIAVPEPEMTRSHCSALGCSSPNSPLTWPGRSVIIAAWTLAELSSGLNIFPRAVLVWMCFMPSCSLVRKGSGFGVQGSGNAECFLS